MLFILESDECSDFHTFNNIIVELTHSIVDYYDLRHCTEPYPAFSCDWTQGADSPLTSTKKAEWATYRQALRDIMSNLPSDLDHPDNVSWPSTPS